MKYLAPCLIVLTYNFMDQTFGFDCKQITTCTRKDHNQVVMFGGRGIRKWTWFSYLFLKKNTFYLFQVTFRNFSRRLSGLWRILVFIYANVSDLLALDTIIHKPHDLWHFYAKHLRLTCDVRCTWGTILLKIDIFDMDTLNLVPNLICYHVFTALAFHCYCCVCDVKIFRFLYAQFGY